MKEVLSFLSMLPDPAVVTDENGTIVQSNPAADHLFGCGANEMEGLILDRLLPEECRAAIAGRRAACRRGAAADAMTRHALLCSLTNRRNESLYLEINLTPLSADGGNLTVATLREVTEYVATRKTVLNVCRKSFHKTNRDFFLSLARTLANELKATYITIGKMTPAKDQIETMVFLDKGAIAENFRYGLQGTPCDTTLNKTECCVPASVQEKYPDDLWLRDNGLQAYVGVRLHSSSGEAYGLINALYAAPITPRHAEMALYLLNIIALRAAPELERLETEDRLNKLSQSVEFSPSAVVITDRTGMIEYVNPRYCEITGFSFEECKGRQASLNSSGSTPAAVYRKMWSRLNAGRKWQGELLNRKKDGTSYWARIRIFPIKNQQQEVTHFVGMQEDISRDRQLSEQLKFEASHDQLTNLVNRREFERRLRSAISNARKQGSVHCLCFLDLDQFKVVNDSGGHIAGDLLLKKIGRLLKSQIRSEDTAARLGGDEFALILHSCATAQALRVAEKILSRMDAMNFTWKEKIYSIGASIGIVEVDGGIADPVELVKRVDTACYSAKDSGRNRIHVYSETEWDASARRREMDWVPEINAAIAEGRFSLYLQPVVPLAGAPRPYYHEVLIRMRNGAGALVLPETFLPAVERYNLSGRLDFHVVGKVFDWMEKHPQAMNGINALGINLSGASLSNEALLEHICERFEKGRVPPAKVVFEITETAAILNIVEARRFIRRIREYGTEIALDDFGSGLSSFPYLKSLPVDLLKIDGLLVREIAHDDASNVMVSMINEMAHRLGFRTIAEYAESDAILDCLRELGIDYAQGFRIARPGAIEEVVDAVSALD